MSTYVKISAPASLSNFGPGLGTFGLALDEPRDIYEMSLDAPGGFQIEFEDGEIRNSISGSPSAESAFRLATYFNEKLVFTLKLKKNVKSQRGIGGTSAAIAGGAFAMMKLLNRGMDEGDFVHLSTADIEIAGPGNNISGIAAAMYGGFVVAAPYKKTMTIAKINTPEFYIPIVIPMLKVKREDFWMAVPESLDRLAVMSNVGRTAVIINALCKEDVRTFGRSLIDKVSFANRSKLIPHFKEVKAAGKENGAIGVSISGTGPAVFGLCNTKDIANDALKAMMGTFKDNGIKSEGYVTKPGAGCQVLDIH